jgi:hypothetical protein
MRRRKNNITHKAWSGLEIKTSKKGECRQWEKAAHSAPQNLREAARPGKTRKNNSKARKSAQEMKAGRGSQERARIRRARRTES